MGTRRMASGKAARLRSLSERRGRRGVHDGARSVLGLGALRRSRARQRQQLSVAASFTSSCALRRRSRSADAVLLMWYHTRAFGGPLAERLPTSRRRRLPAMARRRHSSGSVCREARAVFSCRSFLLCAGCSRSRLRRFSWRFPGVATPLPARRGQRRNSGPSLGRRRSSLLATSTSRRRLATNPGAGPPDRVISPPSCRSSCCPAPSHLTACRQRCSEESSGVLLAASVGITSALTFVNYIPDDVSNALLALAIPLNSAGDLTPSVMCALGLPNPAAGAVLWVGIGSRCRVGSSGLCDRKHGSPLGWRR